MTLQHDALSLLNRLRGRGIQLWQEEGKLNYRAPQGTLSSEDIAQLKQAKPQLLALLKEEQQPQELTIDAAARHQPFPLSQVQGAYLLGRNDAFGYGGVACHVYLEIGYPNLDAERVGQFWNQLVARHDMLRAVFDRAGSQQVLEQVPPLPVEVRSSDDSTALNLLDSVREEMGHRLYQPEQWPLFSLNLSQLPEKSVLHLSMDFLIADWASIWLLLGEFEALYYQPEQPLPALTLQFRDYLLAERHQLASPAALRDREWWQQRVPTLPSAPQLPTLDLHSGHTASFSRHFLHMDAPRWQQLKRQAAQHNITPTAAVMTAYAGVLQRWAAQDHFCLNLTVLNRQPLHPQVDQIVGDFTAVSLLEVDHRQPASWAERARAISHQLYDDLDHRLYSGVDVMREMVRQHGRDAALMPYVFTSAIGLVPADGEKRLRGQLDGRGITQTPQVFIDCQAMDSASGLQVNWDVRDGVFPEGLIDDLFAVFEQLLQSMAGDDALWQQRADVGLPVWQQTLRQQVNATEGELPQGGLHLPFFAQAKQTPAALAVCDAQQQFSYQELAQRALSVAEALRELGVTPGEHIAITIQKGVWQAVAVLGAMAAGAVWLPVDLTQPPLRREQILTDAGVRLVLTTSALCDITAAGQQRLNVDAVAVSATCTEPFAPHNQDPAYIIYTSGSTGQPKGVVIAHQAARNTVDDINRRFAVNGRDRGLALAQLGFDLAVYDLFGLLSVGGAVIYPQPERATDPSHWAECIDAHQVSLWNSVPALMQMLENWLQGEPGQTLGSLRLALLSGDWIPLTLPETLAVRLPGLQLVALGGATEAAIWSNFHCWQGREPNWSSVPYGLPLTNQGFRVLNAQRSDCPVWVSGDLYIYGAGLAQGYLHDAEKTARHFINDARDGERLYWTGDRARYLPTGELEFLGRADNQLKIKGHRIEPGEIEAALCSLPQVDAAYVVPQGEGSQRQLLALVTSRSQPSAALRYDAVIDAIDSATAQLSRDVTAEQLQVAMQALDSAVLNEMHQALLHYGLQQDVSDASLSQTAIKPQYWWLVRRWHSMVNARLLPLQDNWASVEQCWHQGLSAPTFLSYIRQNLDNLPALLEGRLEAHSLLFPQGELTHVQALYRHNLMAKYLNQAVSTLCTTIAAAKSPQRPLRILEVGAGTGGTSEDLLAALSGVDMEYSFTDVSPFFLPEARARFADRPGMRFALLDIDRDIRSQGFAPESYDIVLAAGVLENARDQSRALHHLQLLTAPQGWIVLTEPTREHPWIMASQAFMMAQPEDDARQQQSYLDVGGWQQLMQQVNDAPVLCLPQAHHPLAAQGFHLLAQQVKRDRQPLCTRELTRELQRRLPAHMVPAQLQLVTALPLTANGKRDPRTASSWWLATVNEQLVTTDVSEQGDALERLLMQHWADALGVPQIGLDQDVYDLGADSLIMARLAGKLRQSLAGAEWQLGDIPFDALLRHMLNGPDVRALAQAIRRHRPDHDNTHPAPVQSTTAEVTNPGRADGSNAILMPFGGGHEGPLRVVFHAGLGTMDCFRPLLAELDAQQRGPVLGIVIADTAQYCDLSPAQAVENMADDYVARLLATGHDRFQLIGYCLGGLFAVEVARRLSEQGVTIDDLVLISSHPVIFEVEDDLMIESLFIPNLHITLSQAGFGNVDGDSLIQGFMQVIAAHNGRIPQGALTQLAGETGQFFGQLAAIPIEERFARYVFSLEQQTGQQMPAEMALGLFRVFRQSFHAARFTPDVYIGDIRFLLPAEGSGFAPGMDENTLNFWRDICLGEFSVTPIAGNHFSCIESVHASAVAALVAGGLR